MVFVQTEGSVLVTPAIVPVQMANTVSHIAPEDAVQLEFVLDQKLALATRDTPLTEIPTNVTIIVKEAAVKELVLDPIDVLVNLVLK